MDRDYPQDSDFRQDNDFFYLTGVEAPDGWLVLNASGPNEAVLYLPEVSPSAERWTGSRVGPGPDASRISGVADVRSAEALQDDLSEWFGGAVDAVDAVASPTVVLVSLGDPAHDAGLDSVLPPTVVQRLELAPVLARLRLVKDRNELRRLRRAVEITMEAHREVWRLGEPGVHEYELEAALEFVFRVHGAERVGFPSIVGSGPNSVVLHYDKNRRALEDGDLVVVDIGAEYGYYTADLTRTFPASGRFTRRQRDLYNLVLGARDAALAVLQPGVTLRDLQQAAREHFQENSGDLCGEGSCLRHFVHGLAHWLGMDVHDVGDYSTPLRPGMVFTIEPGLYLAEEGLGIRIEDDVLVTEDGYEVLSEALPRSPDEIEAAMAEAPRWVRGGPGSSRARR
jgi:Xaa-Pro aminopeptidase